MVELFANNAHGTIALGGLTDVATTLTLNSGEGARFPSPAGGDFFRVDLENVGLTTFETAYCTSRSGDVLTIQRAQDGSIASAFAANDRVRHRPTSAMFDIVTGNVEAEPLGAMMCWVGQGTGHQSSWGMFAGLGPGNYTDGDAANTSVRASIPGVIGTCAIANSNGSGWNGSNANGRMWRGNATNRGGFEIWYAFGLETNPAGSWAFVGIDSQVSTNLLSPDVRFGVGQLGVGYTSGSATNGNFQFFRSDGGTIFATDTGIQRNTTGVYLFRLYALPNASTVRATIYDASRNVLFDQTYNSGLPTTSMFLSARALINGVVGAAIRNCGFWRFNMNQSEPYQ